VNPMLELAAYVTNGSVVTLSVIDPSTILLRATVQCAIPQMALQSICRIPSIACNDDDNSIRHRIATIRSWATVTVWDNPSWRGVNSAGTGLKVAIEGPTQVSVIDTATKTVVATIPVAGRNPHGVGGTSNGKQALARFS